MNTNKWGPHAWEFLHTITFNYPIKPTNYDRMRYKNLFMALGETYPCSYCRESYKKFIQNIPIENFYNSRYGMVLWLYLIHDQVNKKLGKISIPFSAVVSKYEAQRAGASKYSKDKQIYIINCFIRETYKRFPQIMNNIQI